MELYGRGGGGGGGGEDRNSQRETRKNSSQGSDQEEEGGEDSGREGMTQIPTWIEKIKAIMPMGKHKKQAKIDRHM